MNNIQNFEKDIASLENILEQLQKEDTSLQDTLSLYANAANLISTCSNTLQSAKLQIEEISNKIDEMELNVK